MNAILERIHADHERFERLLRVTEDELRVLGGASRPDYEVLCDVLDYMTRYPDRCHHPVEDRLFAALADVEPALAPQVRHLAELHRRIADSGRALRQRLEVALSDAQLVARAAILEAGEEYVELFREHLRCEESVLLPATARKLAAIAARAPAPPVIAQRDPLASGEGLRYRALARRLSATLGCGCRTA